MKSVSRSTFSRQGFIRVGLPISFARLRVDPTDHARGRCFVAASAILVLFNTSVWESIDALHAYTYRTPHSEVYAGRKQWFVDEKSVVGGHALAMWWLPKGELPTVATAKEKLARITTEGPSEHAFHFKKRFPPPH